jgi:hypothetical protein
MPAKKGVNHGSYRNRGGNSDFLSPLSLIAQRALLGGQLLCGRRVYHAFEYPLLFFAFGANGEKRVARYLRERRGSAGSADKLAALTVVDRRQGAAGDDLLTENLNK